MAGTIVADFIRTDANQLSLNVGNTTFATINASGFYSNTGIQLIAANGKISGASVIANSIPGTAFATAAIPSTKIGTGAVLQVVNATFATQTTSSTGTMVDTGLTATITPSSASSKILVIVQQTGCGKTTSDVTLQLRLMRGATELFEFESAGAYTGSGATNVTGTCGTAYLDSPATTSAVTYKTQMCAYSPGAIVFTQFNVGSGAPTSTITLMEIAG